MGMSSSGDISRVRAAELFGRTRVAASENAGDIARLGSGLNALD